MLILNSSLLNHPEPHTESVGPGPEPTMRITWWLGTPRPWGSGPPVISKIFRSSPVNKSHAGLFRLGSLMVDTSPVVPLASTTTSVANCDHQPFPSLSPPLVRLY